MKKIVALFPFLTFFLMTCNSQTHNILLVNIENVDRGKIAEDISIIDAFNPKVIAIDLQFDLSRHDGNDDKLVRALWNCRNLVMASLVHDFNGKILIGRASLAEFSPPGSRSGFINALQEDDVYGTLKRFKVWEKESYGDRAPQYHFAVRTAMSYDSIKAMKFVIAHSKITDIDYKGGERHFKIITTEDLLNKKVTKNDIEGKIVMISFLGPGNEDKFYTPLNKNHMEPDMYGVEYLANVVAQILEK